MKGRGFILAVLVLGLLAAAVFGVKLKDEREGKIAEGALILPYSSYDVRQLRIELHEPPHWALFVRADKGWTLREASDDADPEYVGDVLSAWSQVRYVETVDEEPDAEALERYGLAEPQATLEAQVEREGESPVNLQLEIGKVAPLLGGVPKIYARLDGFERVVLVEATAGDLYLGVGRQVLGLEPLIERSSGRDER